MYTGTGEIFIPVFHSYLESRFISSACTTNFTSTSGSRQLLAAFNPPYDSEVSLPFVAALIRELRILFPGATNAPGFL